MQMRRADALTMCASTAIIAAVLPLRPFWLDEVLQLVGTRPERTLSQVVGYVPENPGSAPLGYVVQHVFLRWFGVSRWSARLPSALFALASCFATITLARRAALRHAWLAGLLFCCLPLTLRYAAEARPYSQAVFLSVAATLVFLGMPDSPRRRALVAYAAVLVAGVYTHPFTLLTAGGHVICAVVTRRWRLASACAVTILFAGALFTPWVMYAGSRWQKTILLSHFQFVAGWKTPAMLFRELSGAGYWGSGLLFALAAIGARALPADTVVLLVGIAGVTLLGGIAADAAAGYFVAVRQFICALPPVVTLAAARPVAPVIAALLLVCAWKNAQYFRAADEDWESASAAIAAEVRAGRCLLVEPAGELRIYAALVPALSSADCREPARQVVLAVPPYHDTQPVTLPKGYAIQSERRIGGTRILILTR
ncbi:MAG TPA: glycosyltransferase family 39 protein [Bryobacteraceae bacterium]|nr:glycosyltransferase family 39 protein [Bryobacteraceae bacterium]